jgi:hypothetical protein
MLKDKTFTYKGHTFQVRASLRKRVGGADIPTVYVTHETATDFATAGWRYSLKLSCGLLRWKCKRVIRSCGKSFLQEMMEKSFCILMIVP